ncbi:DUF1834 family protein, partial [Laribacter hongkongensis]
ADRVRPERGAVMDRLANPISEIEMAIQSRLREGLGRLVRSVETYAGELDDDLGDIVRALPAAWVTFGGVQSTAPHNTRKDLWHAHGLFVVLVGAYDLSPEYARRGRPQQPGQPVGSYGLVRAVRRLLTWQDMGLPIGHLEPGRVRVMFNGAVSKQALSVYACEFRTSWLEEALPVGRWPAPDSADDQDAVFAVAGGRLDQPAPEWLHTGLCYHLAPDDGRPDAEDQLTMRNRP